MPYPAKTNTEEILAAAISLLEQPSTGEGDPLTMRALASSLGLRASSLYRHYADRERLNSAVADETARRLLAEIEAAIANHSGPEALYRAGHAYLDFAHAHPRLYALLHQPRPPALAQPGPEKELWNLFLALVGAISGQSDDTPAAVALWCFLHGYVGLESSGQFGLSGPGDAFTRGLAAFARGL